MKIRKFEIGDEAELLELFRNTIRLINSRDYDESQVRAWAPDDLDEPRWRERIGALSPFVCEIHGRIAGYADLQPDGFIDHFYVRHDLQGRGIGKALFGTILQKAREQGLRELTADVSITAQPFFASLGFEVTSEQRVVIGGVELTNFRMQKAL